MIDARLWDRSYAWHETIDKDHRRIETRRCWSTWGIGWLKKRAG